MNIEALLETFPRVRPPLTEAHQRVYEEEYKKTRGDDKPLTSKVSSGVSGWMHRKVARMSGDSPVLEIGAGTLNHLAYENIVSSYDVVEPFAALYNDNPDKPRLRQIYTDIRDVPEDQRYGRIISIAALEHLTELPAVVAKSGLLLEEEGVFQAGIPSEGGLLWGLAWRLSTGIAYRLRTGLDYETLMRHEHINTAREIIAVVRYLFDDVKLSYFPLPGLHISLFMYLECTVPKTELCKQYLEGREA